MNTTLDSLFRNATVDPQRHAIVTADAQWTWRELVSSINSAMAVLAGLRNERVGILQRGDGPTWAALAALERLDADVFLLNASLSSDEIHQLADEFKFAAMVDSAGDKLEIKSCRESAQPRAATAESGVTILTSGTTGRPKAARHTWTSLCRPVRVGGDADGAVWMLTYRPNLYAGLQVALQCFGGGGTLVYPGDIASIDQIIDLIVRNKVAYISATPSYWRRLLIFGDQKVLRTAKLRQITLGGELIDQHVLDMLKETFPESRLVHIYATTELGRCFSVTDGKAGFPARFVGAPSADGVELRVEDDELFVRSANAMQGYQSGDTSAAPQSQWFATGDLVRREADRYQFVGRRSDIINVGGNKVSPLEVERVLRAVPGVAEVRVYAKQSSVAGQLVAAQIVPQLSADAAAVKAAVIEAGVRHLAAHQRPRLVDIVDRIELSDAGKVVRK